jgi:hypothetical protein
VCAGAGAAACSRCLAVAIVARPHAREIARRPAALVFISIMDDSRSRKKRSGSSRTLHRLDPRPHVTIDPLEHDRTTGYEIIDRLFAADRVTVVVNDDHATRHDVIIKTFELECSRIVSIGIEPQQGNGFRVQGGDGLQNVPSDDFQPLETD